MMDFLVKEEHYNETMEQIVVPYLEERKTEQWYEREEGKRIYCVRYLAEKARGTVLVSHGFTETTEKYLECIYYFLKGGYNVYAMEHCGHGRSYRLTDDKSLVHVDSYERYVDDLLFVADSAKKETAPLPLFLFGHSMGGGIAAAAAAKAPKCFDKVILSSPMIRPLTRPVPLFLAKPIIKAVCAAGRGGDYVIGQVPYGMEERFERSASTSQARFAYYQKKRREEPLFQMNAPSYSWISNALKLNEYLQSEGWQKITTPMLLFQARHDTFVSKREQNRFIRKIAANQNAKLVRVPGVKHEILNATDDILEIYWKKIYSFLQK